MNTKENSYKILTRSTATQPNEFAQRFAALSANVRQEPYRVGLAPAAQVVQMMNTPLPAPVEFFLLSDAATGKDLGRIGANLSPVHPGVGYVGFFDVDLRDPASEAYALTLLRAASEWLRSQGAKRIVGPVDYNTWFTYRFRTEFTPADAEARAFSWEPANPPEYPKFFEKWGMAVIQNYHSQGFAAPAAGERFAGAENAERAFAAAEQGGFRFREFDLKNLLEKEVPILHRLSHSGFEDAFLFEPIPLAIFTQLYAMGLTRFDFSPSRFVVSPEGKEIGFLFAFFDGPTLIIKTVAVLDAYRNLKLSSAVLHPALEAARAKGTTQGVSALVKSGARSEHHERRHAQAGAQAWVHHYALFGKDLS